MTDRPGEFDIIRQIFAPLAAGQGEALGLRDDAAVLAPSPDTETAVTTDTMVAGVHFLADDPPDLIARKLVSVNCSDLAAMGAAPYAYTLAAAWPGDTDTAWLQRFADGLAAAQSAYGLKLVGGDTVATPGPLSLTLTAFGKIQPGKALTRGGAAPGEDIWVTGTIGDAALGLDALQGRITGLPEPDYEELVSRYRSPTARTEFGVSLIGTATAAMDVSDGLVQDLGHLCEESNASAEIIATDIPLSGPTQALMAKGGAAWDRVLSGGDDYELLFAALPSSAPAVLELGKACGLKVTRIGTMEEGDGRQAVRVLGPDGRLMSFPETGYRHF